MSSPAETPTSQVATSDPEHELIESGDEGESVESGEAPVTTDALATNAQADMKDGRKRKSKTSEVWKYFVEVEVKEKGQMVKKSECAYCKKRCKVSIGGPTTTLKRHIEQCSMVKRAKVLSKLTRDVLSIPITTVASESAFSAGGRVLDDYRSSLTKYMVEILVCGGDWIKATSKATIQTLQRKRTWKLQFQCPI